MVFKTLECGRDSLCKPVENQLVVLDVVSLLQQPKLDYENLKSIASGSRLLQPRLVPEAEGVAEVPEARLRVDVAWVRKVRSRVRVRERRTRIAEQRPEPELGTRRSQCTTSQTPLMSSPRKGRPRSAGDDGEGGGAGSTSIGSSCRFPEQEDAAHSTCFLKGNAAGRETNLKAERRTQ